MDLTTRTDSFAVEDQSWLGSRHGSDAADSITLDGTTLGAVFTDGKVPSGVVLGKITASGKYGPYDDAASDGRQTAVYHLFTSVSLKNVLRGDSTFHDVQGAGFWHGQVIVANLPTSHGLDAAGKVDLKNINYV